MSIEVSHALILALEGRRAYAKNVGQLRVAVGDVREALRQGLDAVAQRGEGLVDLLGLLDLRAGRARTENIFRSCACVLRVRVARACCA
jgi:hypothetical protein